MSQPTPTFEEVVNEVCRDLPEGWLLTIELENGSGIVKLEDPNYGEVFLNDDHCESLIEEIENAVKVAIEQHEEIN